ncbi:MAG: helix-turn-helix domain-containing protein [Desulfovibrio sp.]|jgi:pyocin large subunit-like protein|nr:helix-turn-helix domain-containing protein [Desulfovibrio sp.]
MSVDATRWAWTQKNVTPTQKFVLLALADRADEQNRCWPSISRIESDTGFDRKAIHRALKSLEESGLIIACKETGKPNVYTLVGVENRENTSAPLGTSSQRGTTQKGTSAQRGTSAETGTSAQSGTPTSASLGPGPVPKGAHESKRESKREPNKKSFRCVGENADTTAAAPPAYELPLRSKSGEKPKSFPVTKEIFDCWQEAYPLVDCRAELPKIKAWLVSNPAKRPASDMPRFVNSWLRREQNRGADIEARQSRLPAARDGPSGPRPLATTQSQKGRQDMEDLARFTLAAQEKMKNGDNSGDYGGTWQNGGALPAADVARRTPPDG